MKKRLKELARGYNKAKRQRQKEEQTTKTANDLRERECERIRDKVVVPVFEKMHRWCEARGIDCKLALTPSDASICFATQFYIGPPYPADHWPSITIYTNSDMQYFYCHQEYKLGVYAILDPASTQKKWKITEMTKEVMQQVAVDFAQNVLKSFQPQMDPGGTDARQTRTSFDMILIIVGSMLGRVPRGVRRLN
jgi:hypothetical protein